MLTAVYIMNRLPCSLINYRTSDQVLYNETHDYNLMKVFGCLAFAYNPSPPTDKFENSGVPCIFLGYPSQQKGYRLFNMLSKSEFISRDVTFHETIFPYHSSSLEIYMHHVPPIMSQSVTICDDPEIEYESELINETQTNLNGFTIHLNGFKAT